MNNRSVVNDGNVVSSSLPALCQVIAMAVTYRRLLVVCGIVPLLALLFPFVLDSLYWILNHLTYQHGLFSYLLAIFITVSIMLSLYRNANTMAPSTRARQQALEKCSSLRLPVTLVSFLLSCIVTRFVVKPLEDFFETHGLLTGSPNLSWPMTLRISCGMLLMSLNVVARYIGPSSIVRCSGMPLVSNPFQSLLDLASPSETPGELGSLHNHGRRFQWPTILSVSAQVVIAMILGGTMAFTTVLGCFSPDDTLVCMALVGTSIATPVVHLLSMVWNRSHELDPTDFYLPWDQKLKWTSLKQALRVVVGYLSLSIFVPFLAVAMYFVHPASNNDRWFSLLPIVQSCTLTFLCVSGYLTALNQLVQTVLCTPGLNLKRMVEELSELDTPQVRLEVILDSLSYCDRSLVRDLLAPSQRTAYIDFEGTEAKRYELAKTKMARILLNRHPQHVTTSRNWKDSTPRLTVEAPLEEDILRWSILESLGGSSFDSASTDDFTPEDRHMEAIQEWIRPKTTIWSVGSAIEPLSIPLVRALAAHVGGLGEALTLCVQTVPLQYNKLNTAAPPPKLSWVLPPAAITNAVHAVTAASRCIVSNFASAKAPADWRSTHLSMLVPVVLHCLFRLRCGVLHFSSSRMGGAEWKEDSATALEATAPELKPILVACNEGAVRILEALRSLQGGRVIDLQLDSHCLRWTREIMEEKARPASG